MSEDMQTKLVITSPEGISVLVTDQGRLEIVADVDLAGLARLREMLNLYRAILACHPANATSPSPTGDPVDAL